MIYQYLSALLIFILLFLVYIKIKNNLPKKITNYVSKSKIFILLGYWIIVIIVIGTPVRLESTSISGKTQFSQPAQNVSEKQEGVLDPVTEDFRTHGLTIKQNKENKEKEIKDENPD